MNIFYLSIGVTVVSNILYHFFQKSIDSKTNPMTSLIVTYFVALIASLLIYPFYNSNSNFIESFRNLGWPTFALGLAIVGVELGYLLAYRSGWNVGLTAITVSIIVTILLVPIGIFIFQDKITIQKGIGVVLGIIALILMNIK